MTQQLESGFDCPTTLDTLVAKVLQWGKDKGITGPNGRGTTRGQADKMLEEANETYFAVLDYHDFKSDTDRAAETEKSLREIKDGIGDTVVTLILLAELHGWTLEECLQFAYDEIKNRTGKMVDGTFVKN